MMNKMRNEQQTLRQLTLKGLMPKLEKTLLIMRADELETDDSDYRWAELGFALLL